MRRGRQGTEPRSTRTGRSRRTARQPQVPFVHKLIFNQWLLSLFNAKRFEELAKHLQNETLEGLDENNIHHFHHALTSQLFNLSELPTELLLEYDQNIVRHTQQVNDRRITRGEEPIVWKYFQYLALLFSEIYLDRYFRDSRALLVELNVQVTTCNANQSEADQIAAFDESVEAWPQLNKLAFWMPTGSGKTLLMHVNILQYRHALGRHGRGRELNRILLLTPNEGLSQQHLREFEAAGIAAELFNKDGPGLFSGQAVEIIEVTRLRDEMGDKTVAIDAFEGNNLVLVDEGHRGASAGKEGTWMRARNALCEKGFSFEYSATFGQAVKGNQQLTELYAKSTLCDYSYRYFYADGFGKDYQILNLDQVTQQSHLELYLVACLLSFFQQQRLYVEAIGSGKALVLTPGWACSTEIFDRNIPVLADHYRVIAYDPRSQGRSEQSDSGNDYTQRGHDLHDVLNAMEVESASLLGWSLGVYDILAYIESYGTDRVRSLVLVDESMRIVKEHEEDWGEGDAEEIAGLIGVVDSEAYLPFVREYMAAGFEGEAPGDLLDRLAETASALPSARAAALLEDATRQDFTVVAAEAANRVPVMQVVRKDWAEAAQRWIRTHQPTARVEVLGGHLMLVEYPDELNGLVLDFLGAAPD